ncbi:hypothetical protein CAEBREN_00993 [Caenorhabditis brenneri]|uniref:BAAT/Acyl-CoA thioester hydrolase C-terminal domain-containing protein n=1 Tax=Caenorhabditis brenneri TaxID=135651 RepID=G0M9K7_CAEBE|nr:hypothetical protein CAEBREN_00993 [Caenorhabditis brenneri]
MGLFSSIQLSDDLPYGYFLSNNQAKPFYYTLKLISDSEDTIDQVNLKKRFINPTITQIKVNQEGLHGIIFKPPGPGPFSCVIDIPPITGIVMKATSAVFASEGFVVYTFATYSKSEQGDNLHDVELEDFSKHIEFVKSLPYCSGKIGLFGFSFGGTIANYLASKISDIFAVLCVNSLQSFLKPAYVMKENGKPIECERLDSSLDVKINGVINQKASFAEAFRRLKPETSLNWEHISKSTSFRVVGALDDWLFCGAANSMYLRNRLHETGHSVEVELVPAGHFLSVPYFPHQSWAYSMLNFHVGFGGECSLAGKSQEKVWENNLKFYKKHLGTPPDLPDFEREMKIVLPGAGKADPMGLFLSIQFSDEVRYGHYARNNQADPFYYTLKLIPDSEEVLDQANLRKLWIHPMVTQIEVAQGDMYGLIFKPPGPGPFPCIIDVPGANGYILKGYAGVLALQGFLVYTFVGFGQGNLPKTLDEMDLEIFSRHIDFVKSLPYCSNKIGLFGSSFGGTIANYLVTTHLEITAVVTINPPEAFYQVSDRMIKENEKQMKCQRLDASLAVLINGVKRQRLSFYDIFRKLTPETSLKWEKISKNRTCPWWTSGIYTLLSPQSVAYNKYLESFMGFGGECFLAAKAQEIGWENHLKFFMKHLGTPPRLPDFEREKEIILRDSGSKL